MTIYYWVFVHVLLYLCMFISFPLAHTFGVYQDFLTPLDPAGCPPGQGGTKCLDPFHNAIAVFLGSMLPQYMALSVSQSVSLVSFVKKNLGHF